MVLEPLEEWVTSVICTVDELLIAIHKSKESLYTIIFLYWSHTLFSTGEFFLVEGSGETKDVSSSFCPGL